MHTSMPEKKLIYKLNVYRDYSGKQSNFTKAVWQISIAKQFNLYSIYMSWIEKTINFTIFSFLLIFFFFPYMQATQLIHSFINSWQDSVCWFDSAKVNSWEWSELCTPFALEIQIIAFTFSFPVLSLFLLLAREFIRLL